MNKHIAEDNVKMDAIAHTGKMLFVSLLRAIKGGIAIEIGFDQPLLVEVLETPEDELLVWKGDTLNPHWRVLPMESNERIEGLEGLAVAGHRYKDTGKKMTDLGHWQLLGRKAHKSPFSTTSHVHDDWSVITTSEHGG